MSEDLQATPGSTAVRVALWARTARADRFAAARARRRDRAAARQPRARLALFAVTWIQSARAACGPQSLLGLASSRIWSPTSSLAASISTHLGGRTRHLRERKPELAEKMQVFEVDPPGPQAWKRQRLNEPGFGIPAWPHLVPVDFESSDGWADLAVAGFDASRPAVVASTGVTMYVTKESTTQRSAEAPLRARFDVCDGMFSIPPGRCSRLPLVGHPTTTEKNACQPRGRHLSASSLQKRCTRSPRMLGSTRFEHCRPSISATGTSPNGPTVSWLPSGESLLVGRRKPDASGSSTTRRQSRMIAGSALVMISTTTVRPARTSPSAFCSVGAISSGELHPENADAPSVVP